MNSRPTTRIQSSPKRGGGERELHPLKKEGETAKLRERR